MKWAQVKSENTKKIASKTMTGKYSFCKHHSSLASDFVKLKKLKFKGLCCVVIEDVESFLKS